MEPKWNDTQPIYRQLRDRVVAMILEDVVGDGDALPSVRHVAAEYQLNPLTVMKGYQSLVDEELVEKKRGKGMYVKTGAKELLLKDEKNRFLRETWPDVAATIRRLDLSIEELMAAPVHTSTDTGALGSAGAANDGEVDADAGAKPSTSPDGDGPEDDKA
ncbi:MAG: GntR family transcriptional regulator [Pseudomonadota bacterium]